MNLPEDETVEERIKYTITENFPKLMENIKPQISSCPINTNQNKKQKQNPTLKSYQAKLGKT